MEDRVLLNKLREVREKNKYTYHELSKRLDIQAPTIERWLRTNRINKVYAVILKNKLMKM